MTIRSIIFIFLSFYLNLDSFAQGRITADFGILKPSEIAFESFEGEPEATGVILFESGNYYAIPILKLTTVRLVKKIHRRIKVLDAKKFTGATVTIPYYDARGLYAEEVIDYKAITHNGTIKKYIPESAFYKTKIAGTGNVLTFTFPDVQDGSILEYTYSIVSPYFYDLDGWDFQHTIPTLYSEFQTELPANFRYNRILYGSQKLYLQEAYLNKIGFRLPNNSGYSPTERNIYAMKDIPSLVDESYMLSRKNYVSRMVYEPIAFKAFYGYDQVFTRSWDDVDKRFEEYLGFGDLLDEKNYFRRKLPDSILKIQDDTQRAKAVYGFIRDAYTWNGRFYNHNNNIRDSFKEKLGSVGDINLSLVNALNAANLNAKAAILSTRANGLPTDLYPVLSNFNYILAVLTINGKKQHLDATEKKAPFGVIPFRALNVQSRVLDFKRGSYWEPIEPFEKNIYYSNSQITATDNGHFSGTVNTETYGYIALQKRLEIEDVTIEKYINSQSDKATGTEINNYTFKNLEDIEQPLQESYEVELEPETINQNIVLYPFFTDTFISENPFKLEKRSYPLDFGYPFTNTYVVTINLSDKYSVVNIPENTTLKLPNGDGELSLVFMHNENNIQARFNFKLVTYRYNPDAYPSLKELFGKMMDILKNQPIILKPITN